MPDCQMFTHGLTIGPNGSVRPCCAIQIYGKNFSIDDDWQTRHENWREESQHVWLPECLECKLGEEQNGRSLRTFANQSLKNVEGIVYWDLKINNTCNLACRMCDAWSSSTWEKISRENPDLDEIYHKKRNDRWHRDIDRVLPLLIDAKIVKFTGGEPFLIPQVKRVIDYLIETETSYVIDLSFTTNGTQDIESWLPKLKKFKSVDLVFSVDAVGKRFEYIRSGAKWDQVSENIKNIKRLTKNTNIKPSVIALPQALNEGHIDEVKYWCEKNQLEFSKSPPLLSPDFMSQQALKDPVLKKKLIKNMKILDRIHGTDYRDFINE